MMMIDSRRSDSNVFRPALSQHAVLVSERNFVTFKAEDPLVKQHNVGNVKIDYAKAVIEKATEQLHKDLSGTWKRRRDYTAPSSSNLGTQTLANHTPEVIRAHY